MERGKKNHRQSGLFVFLEKGTQEGQGEQEGCGRFELGSNTFFFLDVDTQLRLQSTNKS